MTEEAQNRPGDLETMELLAEARGRALSRRERAQLQKARQEGEEWLGAEGDRLLSLALVLSVRLEQGLGSEKELRSRMEDDEALLVPRRREDGAENHTCWMLLRARSGDSTELLAYEPSVGRVLTHVVPIEEALSQVDWSAPWFRLVGSAEDATRASRPSPPSDSPDAHPLRLLATLLRPDRKDLLAVVVYAVATGVFLLATPVAVQALVNSIALGGALQPLFVVSTLLLLGLLFAGALRGLQSWVVEILQRRVFARLVAQLGSRLGHVDVGFNDRRSAPELVNRFFDVVTIQKTGAGLLLDGLSVALSVLVGSAVLAFYHPLLLAFDLVMLVAIGLIIFAPLRYGVRTAIAESSAKYEVAAWFEELAGKPRAYRTGGARALVFRRSDEVARKYLTTRASHFRVLFTQILLALALHALASTALLFVGGFLVIQGTLTLGQLVAAELIVNVILASVSKLGKHLENYYDLMAATRKVGALLAVPQEDKAGRSWLEINEGGEPRGAAAAGAAGAATGSTTASGPGLRVEVRCLELDLEAARGRVTLDLEAGPGQRVGVVSPAPGFTQVLGDVLLKARPRRSGSVLLNGQSLASLHPESVRGQVAVLTEPEVVEGSVRRNIGLGRSLVEEHRLQELLSNVGLADALAHFELGLETELSPTGLPFSREEVHALQVVRALIVQPGLVVVDERFLSGCGSLRERIEHVLFEDEAPWTVLAVAPDEGALTRCSSQVHPVLTAPVGPVGSMGSQTSSNFQSGNQAGVTNS